MTDSKYDTNASSCQIRIPKTIGKYEVIKTCGKGAFAVVVLGVDPKTNEKVAIKILDRYEVTKLGILLYLENELRLSSRFDHPNVIKVHDIIYEPDIIMIIMEYVPNGDLQFLLTSGMKFSPNEQLRITYELLQGLSYLHQRGISHRDVKPENIIFDADYHPKFIDFGLSKENSSTLHTYCGTTFYMAPEIFKTDTYDGMKADIWAVGVTINILVTMHYPWTTINEMMFINEMKEDKLQLLIEPKGIIGTIIRKCLTINPDERPSADELLQIMEANQIAALNISRANLDRNTYPSNGLPKLGVRNQTPLYVKARKLNEKVFGMKNQILRYRRSLM